MPRENGNDMGNTSTKLNTYIIRLDGVLDTHWKSHFDSCEMSFDGASTLIKSQPIDQTALHALLRKIRDSGVTILSINQCEVSEP